MNKQIKLTRKLTLALSFSVGKRVKARYNVLCAKYDSPLRTRTSIFCTQGRRVKLSLNAEDRGLSPRQYTILS